MEVGKKSAVLVSVFILLFCVFMPQVSSDPPISWDVTLNFSVPEGVNDSVVFGESTGASDGQDVYDVPKPGTPPEPYIYAFFNTSLTSPYNKLWKDYRDYPDDYEVWNLSVSWVPSDYVSSTNVTFTWNSTGLLGAYSSVLLYDVESDVFVKMLVYNNYTYTASAQVVRDFQIICGEVSWDVTLNFSVPEGVNDSVVFGESTGASDGQDAYDVPKPGTPPEPYIYAFFNTSLSSPYNKLWKDYRDYPDDYEVWNLSVSWVPSDYVSPTNVTISWDCSNLTNEYSYVLLHDVDSGSYVNMLNATSYTYTATATFAHGFQVICGKRTHVTDLSVGWNFVSLPFNQSVEKTSFIVRYNNSDYIWSNAAGGIVLDFIYGWSRSSQNYEDSNTLDPGYGYWMYAYYSCELWVSGVETVNDDDFITNLLVGWNIVGPPFDEPLVKTRLVVGYNGTDYNWTQATTNANPTGGPLVLGFIYGWSRSGQSYDDSTTLYPGYAYWMYAYYDCILKKEAV